ncbi:EGF domain-containing membrane associated protein [Cryptosporidium canis]|uniref:EGF domain-containing membrane associated protein n=1 Tax=Cryptosporidium canis TaxID=195482 RepID=A0ABQ8P388_9CRYT|nr:EGF domain-containing membrane associated protein [Cryptosporidium canis]
MYFENGGGLQEAKSVYSEPPSLIDDISGKLRNVQSVPFESVCAGDQSLNCGQNGKCVSLPTVENQKQFVCICSDGFTGPTCETAWDACKSSGPTSLCLNGGICTSTDAYPYYSCKCAIGFTGGNCEIENNVCVTNNPCQNGGKCTYIGDNLPILCTCPSGYTGDYCQITVEHGIGGAGIKLHPGQIIMTWALLILILASILYCTFSVIYDIIVQIRAKKKKKEKEVNNDMDDPSEANK